MGDDTRFAEVLFYFSFTKRSIRYTLAAVSLFSAPDPEILEISLKTLMVCRAGNEVMVVDAKWIKEVIAMVPFRRTGMAWDSLVSVDEYFMVERTFSNAVDNSDDDVDSEIE